MNALIEKLLQIITQHNHTYKVMIVDDDPDMANLEAEILRYANMEVLTVQQPLHSLQQAAQFQPDYVFLDIGLPGMDGFDLASRLRKERSCAGATIIVHALYHEDMIVVMRRDWDVARHLLAAVQAAAQHREGDGW